MSKPEEPSAVRGLPTASDAELLAYLTQGTPLAVEALQVLRHRHMAALMHYARLCTTEERHAFELSRQALSSAARAAAAGTWQPGAVRHSLLLQLQALTAQWAGDERRLRLSPDFLHWLFRADDASEGRGARGRTSHDVLQHAFRSMPQQLQVILWHEELEPRGIELAATCAGIEVSEVEYHREQALTALRRNYLQTYGARRSDTECKGYLRILDTQARRMGVGTVSSDFDAHRALCADCEQALHELAALYADPRSVLSPGLIGFAGGGYTERRSRREPPVRRDVPPVRRDVPPVRRRHSAPRNPGLGVRFALAILVAALATGVVLGVRR
ncbi:hypothetical protein [Streptomyces sp. NPDC000983]|uniref:hypothetical protein n=1 Tax=Streptomyces sp. NPDC000983 TaxID=3154373 RepID=UPI003329AADD